MCVSQYKISSALDLNSKPSVKSTFDDTVNILKEVTYSNAFAFIFTAMDDGGHDMEEICDLVNA
eukprot:2909909-Pleurochrysis_carterae.AAC.1